MPPAKARNGHGHDDKSESTSHGNGKDKDATNGGQSHHQVNGAGGAKMRRVASAAGSNLRESATAEAAAAHATPSLAKTSASSASNSQAHELSAAGGVLQWASVDRPFLQTYRRVHRLATPTSFVTDYHQWVIGRPGSIGLQSPTMRRTKTFRRQSRDELAGVLKKHYNSQAIQENDVLVEFVHKVATTASIPVGGIPKPTRTRKKS